MFKALVNTLSLYVALGLLAAFSHGGAGSFDGRSEASRHPSPRPTVEKYISSICMGHAEKIDEVFDTSTEGGRVAARANRQVSEIIGTLVAAKSLATRKFGAEGARIVSGAVGGDVPQWDGESLREFFDKKLMIFIGEDLNSAV